MVAGASEPGVVVSGSPPGLSTDDFERTAGLPESSLSIGTEEGAHAAFATEGVLMLL